MLEMMQDCTHIRALEGSQTLLTWSNGDAPAANEQANGEQDAQEGNNEPEDDAATTTPITDITPQTRLKDLIKQYPELKNRLPEINPKFKMLNTPLGKIMMGKADVQTMSERSGMQLSELIEKLNALIS